MMVLPEAFKEKMTELLGDDFPAFEASYGRERVMGLRFNQLKAGSERLAGTGIFSLTPIPWARDGYYYPASERPGRHPYHEAGVYYIQEPSAMAVAELLAPEPGDAVLDLCAAPGGKTTQIASLLSGKGFLLSNEIHPSRAKILSQNVERMGIANCVVTNEEASSLADRFPGYFDKIVVDAPCSGEGMFRKDEAAVSQWSPENVKLCAKRQQEILGHAALMLKPGGSLVYSTCTFSPEENEGTIDQFIKCHPEFSVEVSDFYTGFDSGQPRWTDGGSEELKRTFRIWPYRVEGEGHYLALLKKEEGLGEYRRTFPSFMKDRQAESLYREFAGKTLVNDHPLIIAGRLLLFGDQLYQLPEGMLSMEGLKVVRPGLHLGTVKKNRFEPSHALALHLSGAEVRNCRHMNSGETLAYLGGETLPADKEDTGWVLMLNDSFSTGWSKSSGGILKNHYPKGLRCRLG